MNQLPCVKQYVLGQRLKTLITVKIRNDIFVRVRTRDLIITHTKNSYLFVMLR